MKSEWREAVPLALQHFSSESEKKPLSTEPKVGNVVADPIYQKTQEVRWKDNDGRVRTGIIVKAGGPTYSICDSNHPSEVFHGIVQSQIIQRVGGVTENHPIARLKDLLTTMDYHDLIEIALQAGYVGTPPEVPDPTTTQELVDTIISRILS